LNKALNGLSAIGPIALLVAAVMPYRYLGKLLDKWGFVEDPKEKKGSHRDGDEGR